MLHLPPDLVRDIVRRALAEDVRPWRRDDRGHGPARISVLAACFLVKSPCVLAGVDVAAETFRNSSPTLRSGSPKQTATAASHATRSAARRDRPHAAGRERTALNFIQRLSALQRARGRSWTRQADESRSSTPEDDTDTSCARETRRRGGRSIQPQVRPLRRDSDQGQPREAGRRWRGAVAPLPREPSRPAPGGRRRRRSLRSTRRSLPARHHPRRQHVAGRCARSGAASRRAQRRSRYRRGHAASDTGTGVDRRDFVSAGRSRTRLRLSISASKSSRSSPAPATSVSYESQLLLGGTGARDCGASLAARSHRQVDSLFRDDRIHQRRRGPHSHRVATPRARWSSPTRRRRDAAAGTHLVLTAIGRPVCPRSCSRRRAPSRRRSAPRHS
jgi:hypothetical protein